jgi:HAD superfamily hydrolase (TIGR01450 family)
MILDITHTTALQQPIPQTATTTSPTPASRKQTESSLRMVSSLREIVDEFDVFLLDMWGVLHDGSRPYDGVLQALECLKNHDKNKDKRVIILSNSSKRQNQSKKMLTKLGFDLNHFDQIITSGEISFQMLETGNFGKWPHQSFQNRNVFVLGSGDEDMEYCEAAGWEVTNVQDASLILARGTFTICDGKTTIHKQDDTDDDGSTSFYQSRLEECLKEAAKRKLPMLVANPDKIRPDADRSPMPGYIGDLYQNILSQIQTETDDNKGNYQHLIKRIGKPFEDVYEIALCGITDMSRVCMIGDALETDVTGGEVFGISTVWVLQDGIYKPRFAYEDSSQDTDRESLTETTAAILDEFHHEKETYAQGRTLSPTILMPHFRW